MLFTTLLLQPRCATRRNYKPKPAWYTTLPAIAPGIQHIEPGKLFHGSIKWHPDEDRQQESGQRCMVIWECAEVKGCDGQRYEQAENEEQPWPALWPAIIQSAFPPPNGSNATNPIIQYQAS